MLQIVLQHFNGLAQDCSNSVANAQELLQLCAKPSIYGSWQFKSLVLMRGDLKWHALVDCTLIGFYTPDVSRLYYLLNSYCSLCAGWETSARQCEWKFGWASGKQAWASGILYRLYKRLLSSGECKKILVFQPICGLRYVDYGIMMGLAIVCRIESVGPLILQGCEWSMIHFLKLLILLVDMLL